MKDLSVLADPASPIERRAAAARALGANRNFDAVDALAAAMDVTDEDLRDAAREALNLLGASRIFMDRLSRQAPVPQRHAAARALRHLKDPAAVASLAAGLSDPDTEMRRECAHALAVFGARDAKAALEKACEDPSSAVRWFAVIALGSLGKEAHAALRAHRPHETDPVILDEIARLLR